MPQATVNIAAPTAANQAAVQAILADSTKLAALFAQLSASGMSPVPSSLTAKRADAAAPAPDNKLPLILGLAIGLGGGLLVAGGVGFWYYRRRKNSSRCAETDFELRTERQADVIVASRGCVRLRYCGCARLHPARGVVLPDVCELRG